MTEKTTVYDEKDGYRRTLVTDSDDPKKFHIYGEQDVEQIIDGVKRDRELLKPRTINKPVARIPTIIYDNLVARGIANDDDRFKAWLNSDEAKPYRIWQGAL